MMTYTRSQRTLLGSDTTLAGGASATDLERRLRDLGVELPKPGASLGSYTPFARQDRLVFISGQLPVAQGQLVAEGLVPQDVSIETAAEAARQCAINILGVLSQACEGDLGQVEACLKLTGFVAATAAFKDHAKVVNGASDLITAVLGDKGRHARAAVGVASLPLGAPVEVEAIFALRG